MQSLIIQACPQGVTTAMIVLILMKTVATKVIVTIIGLNIGKMKFKSYNYLDKIIE